jgi:hypothetical protein
MTDPTRRIAKWNAKFDTARVKETLDALRPAMLANVTAVFPMLTAMELQVKPAMRRECRPSSIRST